MIWGYHYFWKHPYVFECIQCRSLDLWACNWWLFSRREPSIVEDDRFEVLEKADYKVARAGIVPWDSNNAGQCDNGGESWSLVRVFAGPQVSKKMESSWHITEHCFSHLFPLSCCPQLWLNCLNLVLPSFINITMDRYKKIWHQFHVPSYIRISLTWWHHQALISWGGCHFGHWYGSTQRRYQGAGQSCFFLQSSLGSFIRFASDDLRGQKYDVIYIYI